MVYWTWERLWSVMAGKDGEITGFILKRMDHRPMLSEWMMLIEENHNIGGPALEIFLKFPEGQVDQQLDTKVLVKSLYSEFIFWLCHILVQKVWTSHPDAQCLSFLFCQRRIIEPALWEFYADLELAYARCFVSCLAHSRHYFIGVIC